MTSTDPRGGRVQAGDVGFDERLARLEQIVAELENGGIALEPAIERYQEGVLLLKDCRAILGGYKKRVEELSNDPEPKLRPYEPDPDASSRGASSQGASSERAQ